MCYDMWFVFPMYASKLTDINATNGETCIVFGVHGFSMGFELRTIWRWWKIE